MMHYVRGNIACVIKAASGVPAIHARCKLAAQAHDYQYAPCGCVAQTCMHDLDIAGAPHNCNLQFKITSYSASRRSCNCNVSSHLYGKSIKFSNFAIAIQLLVHVRCMPPTRVHHMNMLRLIVCRVSLLLLFLTSAIHF